MDVIYSMDTLGFKAKITIKNLKDISTSKFIHDLVNSIAKYQAKIYMDILKEGGRGYTK